MAELAHLHRGPMPELTRLPQHRIYTPVEDTVGQAGKAAPFPGLTFPFDEEKGKFLHFLRVCDAHLSTQLLQHFSGHLGT